MRIGDLTANRGVGATMTPATPSTAGASGVQVAQTGTLNEGALIQPGEVLEGKIVSRAEDGSVVLKTDAGKEVSVKLLGGSEAAQPGKQVQIQFEDVSSAVKTGRLVSAQAENVEVAAAMDKILKSFGEPTGEAQKQVLKALLQFDLPLTKENFKAVQNDAKYAQKLADLIQGNPAAAKQVNLGEEVKNVLVKMMSLVAKTAEPSAVGSAYTTSQMGTPEVAGKENPASMAATLPRTEAAVNENELEVPAEVGTKAAGKPPAAAEIAKGAGVTVDVQSLGASNDAATATAEGEALLSQSGKATAEAKNAALTNTTGLASKPLENTVLAEGTLKAGIPLTQKAGEMPDTLEKAQGGRLEEGVEAQSAGKDILLSLKAHTPDKTAFFRKMDIDATVSNIVTFNRLLVDRQQSMIDTFEQLLTGLKDKGMTEEPGIRNLLRHLVALEPADLDGHLDILKQLGDKVAEMREIAPLRMDRLADQVSQLKQDFDFIRNMNENLVYYQMPLRFEEGNGQLEIAYKKRKKDLSEGHRIFISLDTIHIGCVQALVEMKGKTAKVQFRVEDQALRERFEAAFDELNVSIKNAIYGQDESSDLQVDLGFIERQEPMTVMDLFRGDLPQLSAFEMSI